MGLLKGIKICNTTISPIHQVPYWASLVIKDPSHVLHSQITQRYSHIIKGTCNREAEGLWLVVSANAMHKKAVVRSWAKRRVIGAIKEQLKAHGFDAKGRKLEGAKEQQQIIMHEGKEIRQLIGTVTALVSDQSIEYKYEEVCRQAGMLVKAIMTRCGCGLKSVKPIRFKRSRQPVLYPYH